MRISWFTGYLYASIMRIFRFMLLILGYYKNILIYFIRFQALKEYFHLRYFYSGITRIFRFMSFWFTLFIYGYHKNILMRVIYAGFIRILLLMLFCLTLFTFDITRIFWFAFFYIKALWKYFDYRYCYSGIIKIFRYTLLFLLRYFQLLVIEEWS